MGSTLARGSLIHSNANCSDSVSSTHNVLGINVANRGDAMSKGFQSTFRHFSRHLGIATLVSFQTLSISATAFASTLINGAGATFPQPLYAKWFSEFKKIDADTSINYQGVGSSGGIRQLIAGTVDFGASDEPMNAEEIAKAGADIHHIPTAIGAVVLSYNLPGNPTLKLTPDQIAGLFLGEIKTWNDSKIAATNPGVTLPNLPVAIAYRSDGSGTTAIFTDYLAQVSQTFKTKVGQGKSVVWPTGVGGKGNAGVAGVIKQNPGTIGYIELVFASSNSLPMAMIKNASGAFVAANLKSATAAASSRSKEIIAKDFKISLVNSSGKDAYPITSLTWLLISPKIKKEKGQKIVAFLKWSMSEKAQKMAEDLHFASLPKDVRTELTKKIEKISF